MAIHEPFVLAYPFVFKWRNDYYMIPEAHTQTAVRLYKATKFPDEWQYQKDLLTGDHFVSPTLLQYKNAWWMFVTNEKSDTLRLFYASDFQGPWKEHPLSPLIKGDARTARPAGRPFEWNGKLYRLAQDGYPIYGYAVRALEITGISPNTYAEKLVDKQLVKGTSNGWNAEAMHHIDAHPTGQGQWIAAVDALGQ
jgi:hypothetical protein